MIAMTPARIARAVSGRHIPPPGGGAAPAIAAVSTDTPRWLISALTTSTRDHSSTRSRICSSNRATLRDASSTASRYSSRQNCWPGWENL